MRPGRVLPDAVRQSAGAFREIAPAAAVVAHRVVPSHRAALLRPAGRQNADRDPHPRHAALRFQFQLALHAVDVKEDLCNVYVVQVVTKDFRVVLLSLSLSPYILASVTLYLSSFDIHQCCFSIQFHIYRQNLKIIFDQCYILWLSLIYPCNEKKKFLLYIYIFYFDFPSF